MDYLNDFISNSPVMVFMWVFFGISILMGLAIFVNYIAHGKSESMGRKV